jgi:hypothetical protein
MAKHVLNTTHELDFILIGISSPENQYSLVTLINETLGTDLSLSDNIPYNLRDGKLFNFSLFRFFSEEFGLDYFLIPNTSNFEAETSGAGGGDLFSETNVEESTKLIKELPKTDYFLIIKGEDLHLFRFKVIEHLKSIKEIVQVQNIEPGDLPSRMNLVF